jgi:hypothetical protein
VRDVVSIIAEKTLMGSEANASSLAQATAEAEQVAATF